MPKSSAYTLIEILVVISIIGLFMSVGIVQYRDYARRQSLTSAARDMVNTLRLMQEDALSGNKTGRCNSNDVLVGYKIKFTGNNKYSIIAVCGMGDSTTVPGYKNITAPADTTYSPSGMSFMFKVLGQGTDLVSGTDFKITVTQTSTGKTQIITVSSDGKITWP